LRLGEDECDTVPWCDEVFGALFRMAYSFIGGDTLLLLDSPTIRGLGTGSGQDLRLVIRCYFHWIHSLCKDWVDVSAVPFP
jgi:hypothetical protein